MRLDYKRLIKLILAIVVILFLIILLSLIRKKLHDKANEYLNNDVSFAKNVSSDNLLRQKFIALYPDRMLILACEEDITGDGRKDLVTISSIGDVIETIALIDNGDGNYVCSEPIPAPRENQMIKFFNMDKDNILEVLITGEKKGQVGYAIYRYEDGVLRDIFGEGMEDCC